MFSLYISNLASVSVEESGREVSQETWAIIGLSEWPKQGWFERWEGEE